MTGKDVARLALAVLFGAAVALPIGMMLGGEDSGTAPRSAGPPSTGARAVYSPKVLSDPYFLEEQRKGIEALEQHCRDLLAFYGVDHAEVERTWPGRFLHDVELAWRTGHPPVDEL